MLLQTVAATLFFCFMETTSAEPFDNIFKDRCVEFTTKVMPQLFKAKPADCNQLLQVFKSAAQKGLSEASSGCSVKKNVYEDLVKALDHPLPDDVKFLLWSRINTDLLKNAGKCQGKEFFHIGCTLLGYIFSNSWCGKAEYPFPNTGKCDCYTSQVELAMWREASQRFAEKVKGEVHVLLNGSCACGKVAFGGEGSCVLTDTELPTIFKLKKENVSGFTVLLAHDSCVKETCNSPSIAEFKETVSKKGFPFKCVDDPNLKAF
jgi:hypothetical protein